MRQKRTKTWRFWMTWAVTIVVLLGAAAGGIFYYENLPAQQLKRRGYSADEVVLILEKTSENDLAVILNYTNNVWLLEILQHADFLPENLQNYLDLQDELSVEEVIFIGNHDSQTSLLEIVTEEYYIPARLERYYNYLQNFPELSNKDIVTLVNCNRDREFYAEPEPAANNNDLMLVNKYYYLESDFAVDLVNMSASYGSVGVQMERETYVAFQEMFRDAAQAGFQLYVTSGYRGYDEQEEVYQSWVAQVGAEAAKLYAALPGFSEHQTGRAIDVFVPGQTTNSFAEHTAARWLAENAHRYGFILRYPLGREDLTGYDYEPWHFRYVGVEAATKIFERGLTLEEYVAYFVN